MRTILALTVSAILLLAGTLPFAGAEEPPVKEPSRNQKVMDALNAAETPAFTGAVVSETAETKALAAALAKDPAAVQEITACQLDRHAVLARRDGAAALAVADWIVQIASEVRKEAPRDATSAIPVWQANLARARIGLVLGEGVHTKHWTTAADSLLEAEKGRAADERQDEAYILALKLLREAAKGERIPVGALADHSARICRRLLKVASDRIPVRRAVVKSFEWQSEIHADSSRKSMQSALVGYFDAFAPIATEEDAEGEDQREWNRVVSVVRAAKLKVKVDYLARKCFAASNALSYDLPRTKHWSRSGGGSFSQSFPDPKASREITFQTYQWSSTYGADGSARDVKGDNIKGLAGRSFDTKIESLTEGDNPLKIKKKKKPSRKRFNKNMPAGIEYIIEYENSRGRRRRIRCFLVKSVKAELTVQISIYESAYLKGDDPEWRDVVDSFDITKKKR